MVIRSLLAVALYLLCTGSQKAGDCEQSKKSKESEQTVSSLRELQANVFGISSENCPGRVPASADQGGVMCVLRSCQLPVRCCLLWSFLWSRPECHYLLIRHRVLVCNVHLLFSSVVSLKKNVNRAGWEEVGKWEQTDTLALSTCLFLKGW